MRKAIKERVKSDACLGPGERRAKAVVNAHTKPDVIAQIAIQAELVRVRKLGSVAIRGAIENGDAIPFGNLHAREF
jgi:hypothetical protein